MTPIAVKIKQRIEHKRRMITEQANKQNWSKCIELEGEVVALELVWEDLRIHNLIVEFPHTVNDKHSCHKCSYEKTLREIAESGCAMIGEDAIDFKAWAQEALDKRLKEGIP